MRLTEFEVRGRFAGIGWPLVGSAAGHVLALACGILLIRASPARPLVGVVEVLLVEAGSAATSVGGKPVAAFGGDDPRAPGVPPSADRVLPPTPGTLVSTPSASAAGISPPVVPAAIAEGPVPAAPVSPVRPPPGIALSPGREAPGPVPVDKRGKAGTAGDGPTVGGTAGKTGGERSLPQAGTPAGRTLSALLPAAAGGGAGGVEQGAVRLLRDRIEARIVYPEEAVRRGQEGVVLLRIRVGEGGIPKEIRVARSSGARVLDEAARTGVVRAAPLPSIPGWFEVPVRFLLR